MKMPFLRKKKLERQVRVADRQDNTFRRSRTLTGSLSSAIRAAGEERGRLKSDRIKKQNLKRHQRLLLCGLAGLLAVIGGLYYLLGQYIGAVHVTYAPEASTAVSQPPAQPYSKAVLDYLGDRPAQRFRFALNETELSTAVSRQYPEVSSVKMKSATDFSISFRKPVASWKIGSKQYFVDKNGESFEKNYFGDPPVSVIDKSGATVGEGSAVASKGFLRFLGRLVDLSGQSGLGEITEAALPPATTRQIDIKLQGRGYVIKTYTGRDPAATVEDMQRVIGYLEQRKIMPTYIDVRVNGRAYYR